MKKKYWSLIISGFVLLLILAGIVWIFATAEDILETRERTDCANYFLDDYLETQDLIQLCDTENCVHYFEAKMNRSLELAGKCLE